MKKKLLTVFLTFLSLGICIATFVGTSLYQLMYNMTEAETSKALVQNGSDTQVPELQNTLPDDFYMLLLGVDSSENREKGDEAKLYNGSFRSDSIIVAHVNLVEKKIALCSLERDIKTEIEGHKGYNKLNAAYAFGGVELMRKEAEKLIEKDIPYYAIVNMDGLVSMIDSVGGIEVDVEKAFFDTMLNNGIDQAGMQHLDGQQAILYARSRYAWAEGDFARARHQRQVLRSLASKAMSNADLIALYNMSKTVSMNVATNISAAQIFEIGTKLRGLDTENNMYSLMTPTIGEYTNGVSYQILDKKRWETILDSFYKLENPDDSETNDENNNGADSDNANKTNSKKSNMKAVEQAIAEGKYKPSANINK